MTSSRVAAIVTILVLWATGILPAPATGARAASDVTVDDPDTVPLAAGPAGNPCPDDGASGPRIQVVYAVPEGSRDRLPEVAEQIRRSIAATDAIFRRSAAKTGGQRSLRLVTDGSCRLVIDWRVVSTAAGWDFQALGDDVRSQGLTRADRRYLVYLDSAAPSYCGLGEMAADDRPAPHNTADVDTGAPGRIAIVHVDCWDPDGRSPAHELVHTLGGVQHGAPNADGEGHCTDGFDVMCLPVGAPACPEAERTLLDCGNDDYFHTDPPARSYLATHWNVADSRFLSAAPTSLSPPNDDFAQAWPLVGAAGQIGFDTAWATREPGEPGQLGTDDGGSVWFVVTGAAGSPIILDTTGSDYGLFLMKRGEGL